MPKGNKRVVRSSVIGPVKKAEDPTIGPLSSAKIGGPSEAGADFSLREPSKNKGSKKQRWIAVYNEALAGECRNSGNPTECARAEANSKVGEMDTKVEPVEKTMMYDAPFFRIKGGAGSGHHGHAGRPGEVGGSLPSGGITGPQEYKGQTSRGGRGTTVMAFGEPDNQDFLGMGLLDEFYGTSGDKELWTAWVGEKKHRIFYDPDHYDKWLKDQKISALLESSAEHHGGAALLLEAWDRAKEHDDLQEGIKENFNDPLADRLVNILNEEDALSAVDETKEFERLQQEEQLGYAQEEFERLDKASKRLGLSETGGKYQREDPLGEGMKETHQREMEGETFQTGKYERTEFERKMDGMRRHKFLTKEIENKLPALYSQENNPDPTVYAKWFHPLSNYTWYATEYDNNVGMFFGYVDTGDYNSELGYFSRQELAESMAKGLPIERDMYFRPVKLSTVMRGPDAPNDQSYDEPYPVRTKSTTVKEEEKMEFKDYPPEYIERRFFNAEKRKEMAGRGTAMSDGSFPISNCEDVQNAVSSLGRTDKPRAEVVRHIRARAKSIGCKMTPALKRRMVFWDDYLVRKSRRDEANAVDYQLIERHGDTPIHRPSRVDVMAWRSMPDDSKTVRAEATRRIIHRNYAQEVEDAQTRGWKAHINHYEPDEHYFTKMVDTDAGDVMVRALLLRNADEVDWRLHVVSEFASGSLASMLPDGLVRHNKKAMLQIPVLRGGAGSGHHGHEGRPGEKGGSLPSGASGGKGKKSSQSPRDRGRAMLGLPPKDSQSPHDRGRAMLGLKPKPSTAPFDKGREMLGLEDTMQESAKEEMKKEHAELNRDRYPTMPEPHTMKGKSRKKWQKLVAEKLTLKELRGIQDRIKEDIKKPGSEKSMYELQAKEKFYTEVVLYQQFPETRGEEPKKTKKYAPQVSPESKPSVSRGGPGSGHHGHSGRIGEVGGSMPAGDSGFAGRKTTSPNPKAQKIHDRKVKESDEMYDLLDELGMIEDADRIKPEPEKRKQLAERLPDMSISQIAREIRKDWGSKVNYAAKPYLDAMGSLESINDNYYADTGISVVSYFLSNAGQWRGDTARATKAELKRRLKGGA